MKTNAMRFLDKLHINYEIFDYTKGNVVSGIEVADYLKIPYNRLYKTLVCENESQLFVFLIGVDQHLDMKKAAKIAGVKHLNFLDNKLLFKKTGYYSGGCSVLGMIKQYPLYIDDEVNNQDSIYINGGKIGYSILLKVTDLLQATNAKVANIRKEVD